MSKLGAKIFSEIEPLKWVMLHRPGCRTENLMPDYLEDLSTA